MRTYLDANVFLYSFLDHLASAEAAGCDEFLTEDLNDGQTYGSVRAVNPFK